MRQVFIDLHGTIADFAGGVQRLFNLPALNWSDERQTIERAASVSSEGLWAEILRQEQPAEWWAWLRETEEQERIIEIAREIAGRGEVSFVTSPASPLPGLHHETAGSTRWVARNCRARLHVCYDKSQLAKRGRILIDDNDEQINRWRAEQGIGFLVPRPWNSRRAFAHEPMADLTRQILGVSTIAGGRFIVDLPLPPEQLRPNRKTVHAKYGFAVKKKYRQACESMIWAALRDESGHPQWREVLIDAEFVTDTGTEWDQDNAIAAIKQAADALQRQGAIKNDKLAKWGEIKFTRASRPIDRFLRLTVHDLRFGVL